jgi:L-threonylcarbamoyladenylate synthase
MLADGAVLGCPTEAVWGLSCDPWNEQAVNRLLAMKARPWQKGLILVAASLEQLDWLLKHIPRPQRSRLELSWPGPTTWLVPHEGRVPEWVCGEHQTVALRVTDHPVMAELCRAFGGPLVSTSANRAGAQAAREQFQVQRYFGRQLDGLVPGRLGGNRNPSTIRDLQTDKLVRAG